MVPGSTQKLSVSLCMRKLVVDEMKAGGSSFAMNVSYVGMVVYESPSGACQEFHATECKFNCVSPYSNELSKIRWAQQPLRSCALRAPPRPKAM